MSSVPRILSRSVIDRAENRCEYCRLSPISQEAVFHIDHVIPQVDGGTTTIDNLALACVSCSLRKWANRTAVDPQTNVFVRLFNPRADNWDDHFEWREELLEAKSPNGRATIELLKMNRPVILGIRKEEMLRGRHPPV